MPNLTLQSLALATALACCGAKGAFVHPGLMYNQAQIDTFKAHALSGDEPWSSTYAAFRSDSRSSSNYTMKGPASVVGTSDDTTVTTATTNFYADALAVHFNGLNFAITGDAANAEKVAEIVDAWSSTLEEVTGGDNFIGTLPGWDLINGAELVYYLNGGWPTGADNFARAQQMCSDLFVPTMYAAANPPSQPVPGGNQAFGGHRAGMSYAIFTNNQTGFDAELEILMQPFDSCTGTEGSGIQALIQNVTGQCAEAGRDQGHSADEIGWIEEAARVAYNQGHSEMFDLVSQDGNETPLLLLAYEYYFKYNLGNTVPFDTTWHPCCCGSIDYTVISNNSRGVVKPIGESTFNYYVSEKGLSMPYTQQWLTENRPLQVPAVNPNDFLCYSTLTWAAGKL